MLALPRHRGALRGVPNLTLGCMDLLSAIAPQCLADRTMPERWRLDPVLADLDDLGDVISVIRRLDEQSDALLDALRSLPLDDPLVAPVLGGPRPHHPAVGCTDPRLAPTPVTNGSTEAVNSPDDRIMRWALGLANLRHHTAFAACTTPASQTGHCYPRSNLKRGEPVW